MALLENFFLNPLGLLALLSLIPLIIIYLIKPKPKRQLFPSLEFLMRERKERNIRALFSKFVRDPLFLIQLLALTILAVSIAYPYINVTQSSVAENVVVILDASASMQTKSGLSARFDIAKDIAKNSLSDTNTLILVSDFPEILLEKGSRGEASRLIDAAKPKATTTNLYDSMILAGNYLPSGKGKVTVISDFIHTTNDKDVNAARRVLESKGTVVEYKGVLNDARNIGIVDLKVKDRTTEIRIKNFNKNSVEANLKIGSQTKSFNLKAGESDVFTIDTPPGLTEVLLSPKDDLDLDNAAYISAPEKGQTKILFITNSRGKYLFTALNLLDTVRMDVVEPPVISNFNYDVFVFYNVDKEKLLPGQIKEISAKINQGSGAMIVAQNDFKEIGYGDFLPISIKNKVVKDKLIPIIKREGTLTEEVTFGTTRSYFDVSGDITTVAFVQDANISIPVVGIINKGAGKVIYYGLLDDESSFQFELLYPVFWKRAVGFLTGKEDIKNLNFKSGKILNLGEQLKITEPNGNVINVKSLELDQAGVYQIKDKKIAVNLLNDLESDINGNFIESESGRAVEKALVEKQVPQALTSLLAIVVFSLVVFELFYIKYRGDL